ncbi:hypothetical protein [Lysobacter gummosus]|uniref:GDSL-like Lipase/Acylhydrolase family protein n=1 Tax=Lysobacter gummosus TaxID=262324 RepID=A0ABY3X8C9_9GAMM|nr:hypothetical protein [Lysobacter gummosus]ALN93370.1 hypothetical protein LG3211_4436 [Lysobacter gummosus]UNP28844.1 hypothetical protein MOV92_20560 [Lysobacter gummosus]
MPASQSVALPLRGQFRSLYTQLKRARLLERTPVIFCEGDSWFSTPLAMNLLDWIVSPAPEDEERGVPLLGNGGLFFRAEHSGDHASRNPDDPKRSMFVRDNIDDIIGWYDQFDFDMILLSAGGNDFVDDFLKRTLRGQTSLSAEAAFQLVLDSGKYETVRKAYALFLQAALAVKPDTPILAHTYDHPQLIGRPGALTPGNIGVAALLKKKVGPWIGPHISAVVNADPGKTPDERRRFVRMLIDGFEKNVLRELKNDPRFGGRFDYVDLRGTLTGESQWFDEMHPTEAGFHALATKFRGAIIGKLPAAKR